MKAIIRINQNAAVMAGVDNSGYITIDFNPSDLATGQRAELIKSETDKGAYKINFGYLYLTQKTVSSDDITTGIYEPTVQSMIKALNERIEFRKKYEKTYAANKIKTDLEHKNIIVEWMNGPIDNCIEPPSYDNGRAYKIKYPKRLPYSSRKTITDSMIDEIPGLKEHIADLNALIFWLKLDKTAGKTKEKRLEKEHKEIEQQKELEHNLAKVAQIEKWVSDYGSDNQKARHALGKLGADEIIDAIKEQAFEPLTEYKPYEYLTASDVCNCEYDYCDVEFSVEEATQWTEEDYNLVNSIQELMPGANITVRVHTGEGEDCENIVTKKGFKVSLQVGVLSFYREYELD